MNLLRIWIYKNLQELKLISMSLCLPLPHGCSLSFFPVSIRWRYIQGTFGEHSGNIRGTFGEHSGDTQRTYKENRIIDRSVDRSLHTAVTRWLAPQTTLSGLLLFSSLPSAVCHSRSFMTQTLLTMLVQQVVTTQQVYAIICLVPGYVSVLSVRTPLLHCSTH
jgi:hypothetical protein